MALVKLAFVGLCVFLCLSLSSANTKEASSRSVNGGGDDDGDDDSRFPKMSFANANRGSSNTINGGGGDEGEDVDRFPKMMPSGSAKHPAFGSAHLRGNGFGFGFGFDCSMPGSCRDPNRPVTVEYPCPGYGSICNPSPCYPNPPSYGCQTCNQPQTDMAQKVNMKNGAQESPKAATETMPRPPHKQ